MALLVLLVSCLLVGPCRTCFRRQGVRGLFNALTGPGELVLGRCAMVSQRHALTIQRFGCPEACARAPGATAGTYALEAQSRSAMRATHLFQQRIQECFPESLQRLPQRRSVIVLVLATTLVSCVVRKAYVHHRPYQRSIARGRQRCVLLIQLIQQMGDGRHSLRLGVNNHRQAQAHATLRTMGSKSSASAGLMGTQTRPVFGCTQKGALSKWFMCLDTSTSSRGKVCANTISYCVQRTTSEPCGIHQSRHGQRAHQATSKRCSVTGVASFFCRLLNFSLQGRPPHRSLVFVRWRQTFTGLGSGTRVRQQRAIDRSYRVDTYLETVSDRVAHVFVGNHSKDVIQLHVGLQQPVVRQNNLGASRR